MTDVARDVLPGSENRADVGTLEEGEAKFYARHVLNGQIAAIADGLMPKVGLLNNCSWRSSMARR